MGESGDQIERPDAATTAAWSRRSFTIGALALGAAGGAGWWGYRLATAGPETFDTSAITIAGTLPIPPLLEDTGEGLHLVAAGSTTEFIDGVPSATWGFSQPFLGPTIRVRSGQSVPITVTNELDEAITSHWHGLHIPGNIDGGPFNLIAPGESWDLTMEIAQPASTNWYHSHVHGRTGQHVIHGLAGMFLIDDDNGDSLGLPSSYGVDDIPLIVQDRTFLADGTMYTDIGRNVFLGETVVVNGVIGAELDLQAKRNRLRLLNGANGRVFEFFFDDGSTMQKVASEGGFLNAPVEVESVRMSPGERCEIVLDLTGRAVGDQLILRSRNVNGDGGMEDAFDILRIWVTEAMLENPALPSVMNDVPVGSELLAAVDVAAERSFTLRGNAINGEEFDHDRINHATQRGAWELWTVNGGAHPFHVHGTSFLVVSQNGRDPAPEDAGWRDTINVGNGVELLMRFEHEAPPEATYMYHCHLMGHEDAGMMGQFAVVDA